MGVGNWEWAGHYRGKPFHDRVYHGGAQSIPGQVQCAYYDLGGEGVAYHDTDAKSNGSGGICICAINFIFLKFSGRAT